MMKSLEKLCYLPTYGNPHQRFTHKTYPFGYHLQFKEINERDRYEVNAEKKVYKRENHEANSEKKKA